MSPIMALPRVGHVESAQKLTEPLQVTPDGVPHVHAVQPRVSVWVPYETCLFGYSDGHARSPEAYTQRPPKGGGGFGAQTRPEPHPPSTRVPSQARSFVPQVTGLVLGEPPERAQEPPLAVDWPTARPRLKGSGVQPVEAVKDLLGRPKQPPLLA